MPDSLLSILLQKMLSIKVALWSVKRVGKLVGKLALELTTSHTKEVIWSIVVSKILPQPITTLFDRYI